MWESNNSSQSSFLYELNNESGREGQSGFLNSRYLHALLNLFTALSFFELFFMFQTELETWRTADKSPVLLTVPHVTYFSKGANFDYQTT